MLSAVFLIKSKALVDFHPEAVRFQSAYFAAIRSWLVPAQGTSLGGRAVCQRHGFFILRLLNRLTKKTPAAVSSGRNSEI
jgi:hypothetical protein